MKCVTLDLETYSIVDLTQTGPFPYAEHPSTGIHVAKYMFPTDTTVRTWHEGDPFPEELAEWMALDGALEFHNALFEVAMWNFCAMRCYGWPELPLNLVSDTAARGQAMGLPASLEKQAGIMGLDSRKDMEGSKAMKAVMAPVRAWIYDHEADTFIVENRYGRSPVNIRDVDRKRADCEARGIEKRSWPRRPKLECPLKDGPKAVHWYVETRDDRYTVWHEFDRTPETMSRMDAYGDVDVITQHELGAKLRHLSLSEREHFLRTLRSNVNGFRVDLLAAQRAWGVVQSQRAINRRRVREITDGAVTSATQVAALRDWVNGQGFNLDSLDKNAVSQLLSLPGLPDAVHEALDIRQQDGKSSTAKLPRFLGHCCEDGRVRGEWVYHGAQKTGRLTSKGLQCVTGEHEALTPEGWRAISELSGSTTTIMQWTRGSGMTWTDAPIRCYGPASQLATVDGPAIKGRFTLDHRHPVSTGGDRTLADLQGVKSIEGLLSNAPAAGPDYPLTDNEIRLWVSMQADGGFAKKSAVWRFSKQRKVERLGELLRSCDIPFTARTYLTDRVTSFRVSGFDLPQWFAKDFDARVLQFSARQAAVFIDELALWDGWYHTKNGAICLSSHRGDQVEWMATVAALAGRSATVKSYIGTKGFRHWRLYIRSSKTTSIYRRHVDVAPSDEPVYCPTTPGGYWLCRYAGRIYVTGNCHNLPARSGYPPHQALEMISLLHEYSAPAQARDALELLYGPPIEALSSVLRSLICASENHTMYVADYANIEGRTAAWLAGEEWKVAAFEDYDTIIGYDEKGEPLRKGHDLYVVAAASILGVAPGKVEKWMRNSLGKVSELALQFGGGVGAFLSMADVYGVRIGDYWQILQKSMPADTLERVASAWTERGHKSGTDEVTWKAAESVKVAWRDRHPKIVAAWRDIENAAVAAIENPGKVYYACDGRAAFGVYRVGGVRFLVQRLPSNRCLFLCEPRIQRGSTPWGGTSKKIQYMGLDPLTSQWCRQSTYGGDLFQSHVQGAARDYMMNGWANCEAAGFDVLLNIHDELGGEAPDDSPLTLEDFTTALAKPPSWAAGMPVVAEGYTATRFKKG